MSEPSIRQLAEAINKGIAAATGGDHCFNVAHLMRVPGTVNFPTPAKVKRGRGVTLASVVRADNGRTATFEGMAAFRSPDQSRKPERPHIDMGEIVLLTANDLNLSRYDDLRYLIDAPDGADRSKDTYRLAYRMAERGFDDSQIVGVLLNPANAVAAHCIENSAPERAAVRALASAKDKLSEKGQVVATDGGGDHQPLPLIDAGALAGVEVASRVFQVEKLIPAALLSLFTGPGGGGKSYFSLALAASVAMGASAFGFATVQGAAIYITAEDDDDENHRRLIGVASALDVSISEFAGKLFLHSLVARAEKGLARFDAENRMTVLPLFHELRVTILQTGARLVVLDNVAHLFEGNENFRAQVAAFIGLLNALAFETRCAIILVSLTCSPFSGR